MTGAGRGRGVLAVLRDIRALRLRADPAVGLAVGADELRAVRADVDRRGGRAGRRRGASRGHRANLLQERDLRPELRDLRELLRADQLLVEVDPHLRVPAAQDGAGGDLRLARAAGGPVAEHVAALPLRPADLATSPGVAELPAHRDPAHADRVDAALLLALGETLLAPVEDRLLLGDLLVLLHQLGELLVGDRRPVGRGRERRGARLRRGRDDLAVTRGAHLLRGGGGGESRGADREDHRHGGEDRETELVHLKFSFPRFGISYAWAELPC